MVTARKTRANDPNRVAGCTVGNNRCGWGDGLYRAHECACVRAGKLANLCTVLPGRGLHGEAEEVNIADPSKLHVTKFKLDSETGQYEIDTTYIFVDTMD